MTEQLFGSSQGIYYLTAGQDRAVLASVSDDTPVMVPGGEYDVTYASRAELRDVVMMRPDGDGEPIQAFCIDSWSPS